MRSQIRPPFARIRSAILIPWLVGAILLPAPTSRATDFTWNNAAGGNWTGPGNWTPIGPPGSFDTATIDTTGTYTVTLNTTQGISTLALNRSTATLNHTAGTLFVGPGGVNLTAGTYSLNGAQISGGSITSGGGLLRLQNSNGNILSNVAVGAGVLDFSAPDARVRLQGTTTLAAGTVLNLSNFGGNGNVLAFEQSAAANGVTVNMTTLGALLSVEGTNTLTLGPATTVTHSSAGTSAIVANLFALGGTPTVLNQGLIRNTGSGALTINPGVFTNQSGGIVRSTAGTITVQRGGVINQAGGTFDVNGGTLSLLGANWDNDGAITLSSGTLNLGGSFTTAGLGTLTRTGGVVNITGAVDNGAATLALTAATGSFRLTGGTVTGGAITAAGGSTLQLQDGVNRLNNVAVGAGVLDFSAPNARVRLQGTTTLAAGTVVNLSGGSGNVLAFEQTATTDNLTVNMTGGSTFVSVEGNETLTLGPATTITHNSASTGTITSSVLVGGNSAVRNQGLIQTTGSSALTIQPGTFVNQAGGIVRAQSGTIIFPGGTNLTNVNGTTLTGGTWEVRGSGTLNFGGRNIATLAAGTTVAFDGANPTFAALDALTTTNGTLRVLGGKTFTPAAASVANAGVIQVGPGSTFAKAIDLQPAGRLEGTGTVSGAVTVGGVIAPGAAAAPIGTLTTGGQTWAGGGVYEVTYDQITGAFTAGTDHDFLNGTGALTVTATEGNKFRIRMHYTGTEGTTSRPNPVTLRIASFGGGAPATFDLNAFELQGDHYIGGSVFELTGNGTDVFLTFSPVPEPAAVLLVGSVGLVVCVLVTLRRGRVSLVVPTPCAASAVVRYRRTLKAVGLAPIGGPGRIGLGTPTTPQAYRGGYSGLVIDPETGTERLKIATQTPM